jgi:hypothetical protein
MEGQGGNRTETMTTAMEMMMMSEFLADPFGIGSPYRNDFTT